MDTLFVPETVPEEWAALADRATQGGGVFVLIAGMDSGKSTLGRYLARAALARQLIVGFIDSDIGQSVIGPPTTIGLKILQESTDELSAAPDALYFVGATSPANVRIEMVVGTRRLADFARRRGVDVLIVDTTGLVEGSSGYLLKAHKIECLRPAQVVAIEPSPESDTLRHILDAFEGQSDIVIHRLARRPEAQRRNPNVRRSFRDEKLREYFSNATEFTLPASSVVMSGEALTQDNHEPSRFKDVLIAFLDRRGFASGLGILREWDAAKETLRVLAPADFTGSGLRIRVSLFHPYQP